MEETIKGDDVIHLILQFLKENNLPSAYSILRNESQMTPNFLKNPDQFSECLLAGKWDYVINEVDGMTLSRDIVMNFYENMGYELMDAQEWDLAKFIIKDLMVQRRLHEEFFARHKLIAQVLEQKQFDSKEFYTAKSKQDRRKELLESILACVKVAKPNRLTQLLTLGVSKARELEKSKPNSDYSIFEDKFISFKDKEDFPPNQISKTLRFPIEEKIECLEFTPNGQYMLTGSKDGVIEVYNPKTMELATDVLYQNDNVFMMHKACISAMKTSSNSKYLASASVDNIIKVWKISSGSCLKKIEGSHSPCAGVLAFTEEGDKIVSACSSIKIWGLKSGRKVNELAGHKGKINHMDFYESLLMTGSEDGTIKAWDLRTGTEKMSFTPQSTQLGINHPVLNFKFLPGEKILVNTRSKILHICDLEGKTLKTFGRTKDATLDGTVVSNHSKFAYSLTSNGYLYAFNLMNYRIETFSKVTKDTINQVIHHPRKNLLVYITESGEMTFMEP